MVSKFTENFIDFALMGDNSQIAIYAKQLREEQGLDYEESMRQATNKYLFEDSIDSALSSLLTEARNRLIDRLKKKKMAAR